MPENTVRAIIENSVGYAWLLAMAIWGGTASYISRIKKLGAGFSIVEFLGEWTISGFAGIITAYMCQSVGLDFFKTAAAVGIAGHMGGRGLFVVESWVQKLINQWFSKISPDDKSKKD